MLVRVLLYLRARCHRNDDGILEAGVGIERRIRPWHDVVVRVAPVAVPLGHAWRQRRWHRVLITHPTVCVGGEVTVVSARIPVLALRAAVLKSDSVIALEEAAAVALVRQVRGIARVLVERAAVVGAALVHSRIPRRDRNVGMDGRVRSLARCRHENDIGSGRDGGCRGESVIVNL